MKAEELLQAANDRLHGESAIGLRLLRPDVLVKEAVKEAKSQITAEEAQKARYAIDQAETLIAQAERLAEQISRREDLFLVPYRQKSAAPAPPPLNLGDAPDALDYRVRKGDTLWDISGHSNFYGNPWKWGAIYDANRRRIRNPHRIYPGQQLQIPIQPMRARPSPAASEEQP